MDFQLLKEKQRTLRSQFNDNLALRVHRALSWLHKAELSKGDLDAQFIFLWISFNAAYSQDMDIARLTETESFQMFVEKLCELDKSEAIYCMLWDEFSTNIRLLINNQYVFQPFWEYHNKHISENDWKSRFTSAKIAANKALAAGDSPTVLGIILARLYTLRNQLVHGGATWQSSANRDQLKEAVKFLAKLMPLLINIMMDNPDTLWGDANYPVISS